MSTWCICNNHSCNVRLNECKLEFKQSTSHTSILKVFSLALLMKPTCCHCNWCTLCSFWSSLTKAPNQRHSSVRWSEGLPSRTWDGRRWRPRSRAYTRKWGDESKTRQYKQRKMRPCCIDENKESQVDPIILWDTIKTGMRRRLISRAAFQKKREKTNIKPK